MHEFLKRTLALIAQRAISHVLPLAIGAGLTAPAFAALLGVTLNFPVISYDNQGTTTYDATTDQFFIDASPLAIRLSPTDFPVLITPVAGLGETFVINVTVDDMGALTGGAPGNDLLVAGEVDLGALGFYSGVLLTGEVTGFGFQDSGGSTDSYDFTFTVTGGQLAFLYPNAVGVRVSSEQSSFTGDFTVNFGGEAKGTLGALPVAALGDRVWEDLNNNGIQDCEDTNGNGILGDVDPTDPANPAVSDQGPECGDRNEGGAGVPGVSVFLYQVDNAGDCTIPMAVPPAVTDSSGFYLFGDLVPGEYCVKFDISTLPDDFCDTDGFDLGAPQYTERNVGGDPAIDSDADPVDGTTDGVTLAADETNLTLDAGIVCPSKIGNFAWEDVNGDGLQNGEPGVPGISVDLFECGPDGIAGTPDDINTGESRVTNASGEYMFGAEPGVFDLPPGDYYVKFDPATFPPFFDFTIPKATGGDDSNDSDCLPPDGITACVTLGSRGINLDRDCGIIPECDLTIDKQCRVETPPSAGIEKCNGKLQQFTLVWDGPDGISIDSVNMGTTSTSGPINNGDEVTFFGPYSSNDVVAEISGAVNGQSEFHVSCSDEDFNGSDDCGKLAGDGKGINAGFINDWRLEGFIDADGLVLDCTVPDNGDGYAQECSFTLQPGPSCESLDTKPTSLTFKYTGGGCNESDNDQDPSKAVCTPDPDGSVVSGPIMVLYAGSDDKLISNAYMVDPTNVDEGGLFTISADSFSSNSYLQIGDGIATELNLFHTSCSQPLAVGDVFGSLTLVGFNGQTGGVDVSYQYAVTNNGAPLTGVTVEDSELGPVGGPFNLGFGDTKILTAGPVSIAETTTNVATVSAPGSQCTASDSVTVMAVEPVCDVAVVFDDLTDDALKYNLTNTSGIVATLDTFVLNFPAAYGTIKEIKLDGGIYKADESDLVVTPGVVIGPDDWTEPDVTKRELDPGETRTLEVKFTTKHKGGDWVDLMDAGGLVTFEEGCEVSLRAPNACEIDKPTELVFEYTGEACSATTNFQDGGFECEPAAGGAIGGLMEVLMTKDEEKFTVVSTATEVRIFRSDELGRDFPSEIKYDVIGTGGTQSHVLHTSCSKPLNLDDQFGALILREFFPKTN